VQSLLLFAAGTGSVQPPLCHCQPLVWLLVSPSQIHPNQSQAMLLYEAVKPLCGTPPPCWVPPRDAPISRPHNTHWVVCPTPLVVPSFSPSACLGRSRQVLPDVS
jgi:hypothetical protein